MAQLFSGKPFIRKPIFVNWLLKIEYSDKFRESLKQICREIISTEERNAKFQELLDEFYKNDVCCQNLSIVVAVLKVIQALFFISLGF